MEIHSEVTEVLKKVRNKILFFEPLGGNNGDTLIEMGSSEIFKKLNLCFTNDIQEAEVIIINGSGDFSYHSDENPIDNSRQIKIILSCHKKDFIILPSSCTENSAKRLHEILLNKNISLTFFARDPISYNILKKHLDADIDVLLDHDMAFGLIGSNFIKQLKTKTTNEKLTIIERFDQEKASNLPFLYRLTSLRKLIPNSIKNMAKKILLKKVHSTTTFTKEAIAMARKEFPLVKYKAIYTGDISLPQNHEFEDFVNTINSSSIIVSTRLHGCILSYLLDKNFIAVQFEGGNKLKGVYEYSFSNSPKARIWLKKQSE